MSLHVSRCVPTTSAATAVPARTATKLTRMIQRNAKVRELGLSYKYNRSGYEDKKHMIRLRIFALINSYDPGKCGGQRNIRLSYRYNR